MPVITGFGTFASLPEEQVTDKITRRVLSGEQSMMVWWSMKAGAHDAAHRHPHERIAWMLKGVMELRVGEEHRLMRPGEIAVIPGGVEHEAWIREDTEVIDIFAPPREDFLTSIVPSYVYETS
jgi:quercetin dioxygenase-like cupin family protein